MLEAEDYASNENRDERSQVLFYNSENDSELYDILKEGKEEIKEEAI